MIECLSSVHEEFNIRHHINRHGITPCNPSTQEVEPEDEKFKVILSELEASLGYMASCLKIITTVLILWNKSLPS